MCMTVNSRVKLPKSKRNYFYGYKVFKVIEGRLYSKYQRYEYFPGVNKPARLKTNFGHNIFDGALHVYLKKDDALSKCYQGGYSKEVVVPVRCYYKDVIKTGYFSRKANVCMSKVYVDQRSYDKAIK